MIGTPPSPPSFICHPVTSAFVREAILVIGSRKRVYCEFVSTGENYSSCENLNLWRTIHLLRFNSEVIAKGVCILALQWKQCLKATENQSLIFDLLGHRCHNLYFVLLYFLVIKTVRQECRICLAINLIVIILVLEVSRRHRDRKSNFRKNKRITDTLKKLLRYDTIHFSSWHNSFLKLIKQF